MIEYGIDITSITPVTRRTNNQGITIRDRATPQAVQSRVTREIEGEREPTQDG